MESKRVSRSNYGSVTFRHHCFWALGFADLRRRLVTSIEAAGQWIMQEIDALALLRRDAYMIGAAVQILGFHPGFMARLLTADPAALLATPLRYALPAHPDGAVAVSWTDHAASFARYGRAALEKRGLELAALSQAIVASAQTDAA
jgi:uncharacterized protein (DUF302 family)